MVYNYKAQANIIFDILVGACTDALGVHSKDIIPDNKMYSTSTFVPGMFILTPNTSCQNEISKCLFLYQIMLLTKPYNDIKVEGGMLRLLLVVCIKKMIIVINMLEHGVLNLARPEINTYRLTLGKRKELQLSLHKDVMCILNMSSLTLCHSVMTDQHGKNIVKEEKQK